MKKFILLLALTGLVGVAGINTAAAITHTKLTSFVVGEEKNKKEKKKACCKSGDKKCCKEGDKKCCASHKKDGKTTEVEIKKEEKKVEEQK
ncbi:MAG TPA: hypothetical protein VFL70_04500 [Bacteroidia bacterium]|nr:hypothetical protein [Bacteroidia bacterium]